jgi:sulfofructose kinase
MASVLCIGIAVLDYVFQLDEMPVRAEKYRARAMKSVGGGLAANAAVAVARQGGQSHLITRLGDDPLGSTILAELEQEGVNCTLSRKFSGVRSPMSSILVDMTGERIVISYSDPGIPDETDWLPQTLPSGIDAVMGDTRWEAGSKHMFALARSVGKPAVMDVDRKPADLSVLDTCTHAALSLQAARDITGETDPSTAVAVLSKQFSSWIAVTNGDKGVYWTDGSDVRHSPAFKVDVVDTLAAGDTWHGAFALGLAEGMRNDAAITYASAVAALKCTQFGGRAGIPTRRETETFMRKNLMWERQNG